jgi:hypothetical protein
MTFQTFDYNQNNRDKKSLLRLEKELRSIWLGR